MKTRIRGMWMCGCFMAAMVGLAGPAHAQYVIPMLGGDQFGADMVHIDIYYNAGINKLTATIDTSNPTPDMLPIKPTQQWEPGKPWAFIGYKPYNAQYGWNPSGNWLPPAGTTIWISLLQKTPGLECYSGCWNTGSYAGLFGTNGSETTWEWSGRMIHNTYVAPEAANASYWAQYRVYFGDPVTKAAAPGVDDTTVTLVWTARHPGDANRDGHVNVDDLGILASNYGGTSKNWAQADFTWDLAVNVDDLGILASNYDWFDATPPPPPAEPLSAVASGVPEPTVLLTACLLLAALRPGRRMRNPTR